MIVSSADHAKSKVNFVVMHAKAVALATNGGEKSTSQEFSATHLRINPSIASPWLGLSSTVREDLRFASSDLSGSMIRTSGRLLASHLLFTIIEKKQLCEAVDRILSAVSHFCVASRQ